MSGSALAAGLSALGALAACHVNAASQSSSASTMVPASHVDSGFITIDGGRLYYESAGAGDPVILLHGGNLDSRMWEPQFLTLAREHHVVRYDARGFGRSTAANIPFAAHDDLLAVLDTLHIRRASLVGLSLGGRIAIDFALAHPSMVDRLVLAGPGISGWQFSRGDTAWLFDARAARDRGDSVGIATAWLQSEYMRPAMEHSELQGRLRDLVSASAGYWMGLVKHGDSERAANPPALGRTAMIRAPTLLIVGSRDVSDIFRIADTLSATIPKVRRVAFEGAGHMVNMEQPTRFTEVVREFLRP